MNRRASMAPNQKEQPADPNKQPENEIEESEYSKAKLYRFQTIYEFDHKSRSRHYKRELIKKFDKEIKAMRERKLQNVDLMMNEADKVLSQLGNEEDFATFSENLYTNAEQAGKIRGITRLQI